MSQKEGVKVVLIFITILIELKKIDSKGEIAKVNKSCIEEKVMVNEINQVMKMNKNNVTKKFELVIRIRLTMKMK